MKKLFFLTLLALSYLQASASHLEGGELRYEFNGTNYSVYLTIYSSCGGIITPSTETIMASGPSLSSTALTATLISRDTINPFCTSTITKCQTPTATLPGYYVTKYVTYITLPSTGVYTFSYSGSARNSAMNISGGNLYLEATLDNSTAINSGVWAPNTLSVPIAASSTTLTAIPLQGTDAQGDSIVYTLERPLGGPSSPMTYNAGGFSLSTPFGTGSICSLSNQVLYIKAPSVGNYSIAIKMSDYRKGVLVGTSLRDFTVWVLNGTGTYSIPLPSSTTNFLSTTCPGQSNTVTMTFNDPVSTDSVFVDVTPPSLSGFTFTVTPSPGIGSGSSTVSWTSPGSLNPATLPNFYFQTNVRDNACPNKGFAKYVHMVVTGPCTSDSVWAGDANGDKTVNIYDPLAIAIAYGETGASRTGASTAWAPQACVPWATNFISNVNKKHADCDGNGTVNSTDLGAVTSNWSLTHPKGSDNPRNKVTGLPDLYFDHTGIKFTQGATVTVPIKLGSTASPMNNIYGLCARVYVDGVTLTTAPAFTYTGSWLGTPSTTLNFNKKITNNSVDWAYASTSHANMSGQGVIAQMSFIVPSTATPGSKIILRFGSDKMIDKDGNDVGNYNVLSDTVIIEATSTNFITTHSIIQFANIVPNPSQNLAQLFITANTDCHVNIIITDIMGKKVAAQSQAISQGVQYVNLPENISAGMYVISLENKDADIHHQLKWIKQ